MRHLTQTLTALGPLGLFILAILDCAGIPVVGGVDALLIYISIATPKAAYAAAGMAVLGSTIGSVFLFLIARKGGEGYLARYTSTPKGARLKNWFLEYGLLTIFVPALSFIPMPLKLFIISAGAMGVGPVIFTVVLLLARVLRYYAIAWLALHLGSQTLPYLKSHILLLFLFAAGLFAVLYLLIRFIDRHRKLRKPVSDSA